MYILKCVSKGSSQVLGVDRPSLLVLYSATGSFWSLKQFYWWSFVLGPNGTGKGLGKRKTAEHSWNFIHKFSNEKYWKILYRYMSRYHGRSGPVSSVDEMPVWVHWPLSVLWARTSCSKPSQLSRYETRHSDWTKYPRPGWLGKQFCIL